MGKYELTISKNYVPEWGITEAVRELFQNALDQETVDSSNKMFFNYDEDEQVFELGNKNSVLEASSLLLGSTTKANNEDTIGQFGEGYKLAMLILLRNDIDVTFYNYGNKEVWKPRFVNSKRYGQEILTVFTEKMIWTKPPENSLIIRLEGITSDMFEEIKEQNLHIRGIDKFRTSKKYGRLLEDEELRGNIYVNGLYVTTKSNLDYGYDFFPRVLKLKRDRSMVDLFNFGDSTVKLWKDLEDCDSSEIAKMVINNSNDISYIQYTYRSDITKEVYNTFKEQHGDNAIALSNDMDLEIFMEEHPDAKPVVVSSTLLNIIKEDNRYEEDFEKYYVEPDRTLKQRLEVWFKKLQVSSYIETDLENEFYNIVELM